MENNSLSQYQKNLGSEVRIKRLMLKITQKELAFRLGISHEWLNKIENGKANKISIDLIFKIIEQLNLNNELIYSQK